MSEQWDFRQCRRRTPRSDTDPRAVSFHRGSAADFLRRHLRHVQRALADQFGGPRAVAPYLFDRIADDRAMRLAWDDLAMHGGPAPGRNGLRYSDLNSPEIWKLCRCLARSVRNGTYRP